ncbi:MAG: S-layer homology domain-containing protein [Clostridia bacterium]|nr:S-layer homology domain-containing protein [Clostridia bacterium]
MKNFMHNMSEFIVHNSNKIMILASLVMLLGAVWGVGIYTMPIKTYEDSFFMESDTEFIDDLIPLGLNEDLTEEVLLSPFTDTADHWAKNEIVKACSYQVMSPISEEEFAPNKYITRAEFVTVLGRMENIDPTNRKVKSLRDIDSDKFYAPYVAWAEENGILANCKNNKFRPNDNITREEMAVMLKAYLENVRGAILTGGITFLDYDKISSWAQDDVMLVTGSNYLSGRNDGTFAPKDGTTRAELAVLAVRLIEEFDL